MFRISQYMRELAQAQSTGVYPVVKDRKARGPVVIWNLIRRCNLTCKHCYALSADHDYAGELLLPEVFTVMDDLKAFGVPALILSGGEPLLRPDIFEISARAREMGFYTGLSTNGTLIDALMAQRIAEAGFDYVGISLDGLKATHDKFRRLEGAFDRSLAAIGHLDKVGVKVGLRYTMTAMNGHDLPALLDLMQEVGAHKFYFSHLNYAGRGNIHRGKDAHHQATRAAMDMLFDRAWAVMLLENVILRLQRESVIEDKAALFERLRPFLMVGKSAIPYPEAAADLGLNEGAVRVAVHRLRKRYRHMLREEIAQTLSDPAMLEEELQALFAAFAD